MAKANTKPNDVFLTPAEAADLLRISDRSLREFTKRGTVQAVRLGDRTIRYARAEIERIVALGCKGQTTNL
jgi:excisionase family DNA binding protein